MKQKKIRYFTLNLLFISTLQGSEFFPPTDEYNKQDQAQDEKFSKFCLVDPQEYYNLKKKNEVLAELNKQAIEQNEELLKEVDFYKEKAAATHQTIAELKKCIQKNYAMYEELGRTRAKNALQGKILSLENDNDSLQSAHQTMLKLIEKLTFDNHIYEKKHKVLKELVLKSDTEVNEALEESKQTLEQVDRQIKRTDAAIQLVKGFVFSSAEQDTLAEKE